MENPKVLPEINLDDCTGCGDCIPACPTEAISLDDKKVKIASDEECPLCAECEEVCPTGAIAWPYEIVFAEDDGQAAH